MLHRSTRSRGRVRGRAAGVEDLHIQGVGSAGEHAQFTKEAADLLLEAGVIRAIPDLTKLADTRFLK